MCLSGRVPYDTANLLPRWMYHAQEYPGGYGGAPAPAGFTWVDWVFPMFLFSMGVAFPFAQLSRLKKGARTGALILSAFIRGLLIAAFAIYFQHVQPGQIDATATVNVMRHAIGMDALAQVSDGWKYVFAFVGFLILIPIYTRFQKSGEGIAAAANRNWIIKGVGLALAALFLATLRYHEGALGTTFNIRRSNIILMVLANMAFFGTTAWLLTRASLIRRIAVLALFYPFYEAAKVPGGSLNYFTSKIWGPIDWIYSLNYLKYLFIIIPATIIGDELQSWMTTARNNASEAPKESENPFVLPVAMILVMWTLLCLHGQEIPAIILTPFALLFPLAVRKSGKQGTSLLDTLARWGSFWLAMGLLFDSLENGIRKTPSNMSYYFCSLGLSILLLLILTIVIDMWQKQRWFRPFIETGQNPMVGYMAINNVMEPVVLLFTPVLAPISALLMRMTNALVAIPYPWHLFTWAVFKTALLVAITSVLTRVKLIWRT